MASRRFPRNNYRNNNTRNNSSNNKFYIDCNQCNQKIKVLNDDIQFSLALHMQSHMSTNEQEMDDRLSQSSASSGKGRNYNRRQNCVKNNPMINPEQMVVLDDYFYKLPPGLKAHKGFVFESEPGEFSCGLCNTKIDSLPKIGDHLKTKSHEDNTISFIKDKLPPELNDTMEFVSFYGSNLCCNLCRCKIDLSSYNPSKSILNILAHNASIQHANKNVNNESSNFPKEGIKKLNILASLNGVIKSNKHMIVCEMQPQYKCRICDKFITFDQNDEILLKNFMTHFSSNSHNKCARATSVLATFKTTYQAKGGNHNLIVSKGSISCTVCKIFMEPSLETLEAHVSVTDSFTNIDWPVDLSARIHQMDLNGPQQTFKVKDQNNENRSKQLSKINVLLKSMPQQFRNVNYVVESSPGQVTCLICNCVVPATHYNLKTHLTGNSHSKNEQGFSKPSGETNETGPLHTPTSPIETAGHSHTFNPFMKGTTNTKNEESGMDKILDYLKKGNPLIKRNVTLLVKHNDNVYSCKLCKVTIPKSMDVDIFKQSLMTHLSSINHTKKYDEKVDEEVKKILAFDPLVRANKNYVRQTEEHLLCTLCDCKLSMSIDTVKLKTNLIGHLKGQQHLSKVGETTANEAPIPNLFSSSSGESSKVQYNFNKVDDFNQFTSETSSMFKIDPVGNFKGPQCVNKSTEATNVLHKPASVFQNPPEQFKELSAKFKSKEDVFDTVNITADVKNHVLIDPVREQFNKLPANFQSDIAFIEKSKVVEGFFACTLCKVYHINPPYLKNHLEEEKHMKTKLSLRPAAVQGDFQQTTGSKKMMQNMKNFFGFSN